MKRIVNLSIIVSAFLVLTSTYALAEDNLIQNGSFEDYTINSDHGSWKLVEFNNWTGAGEAWNSKIGRMATDGEHKIELDVGRELNELSQIVTTVEGKKYKLSLDAYARRNRTSDFQILVDGEVIETIKPDRKWAEYAVYFVGTGTQQVISLKELDGQNNGLGTIIDNVRLVESQEMIDNGSFENFSIQADHGRWKEVTYASWEGKGEAWNNRIGKRSTNGAYKIELDVGRELNSLSQTVKTEKGLEYELSLDAYARRAKSSDFEILVDDTKIKTVRPIKTWENYSFKFFGNGKAQKIEIKELDAQNNGYGAIIDNVSLVPTGKVDNVAPTITGVPKTTVTVNKLYQFIPKASDENGDTLNFTIQNRPSWAEFNGTTGVLKGLVPNGAEGNYTDINISVSDGRETVSLETFSIEVQPALDIAYQYGKATQGTDRSYGYYLPASNAIDGNDSTMNHTSGGKNDKNWLQIELLESAKISKVVIQNRNGFANRIGGAKVYLSNTPYSNGLNSQDLVYTLEATNSEQVINLNTSKSAKYIIIKGEHSESDSKHLHLRKVEVYGQMPQTPTIKEVKVDSIISSKVGEGSNIGKIDAIDFQGDNLTYTIVDAVPFSVDSNGNIIVSGQLNSSTYTFDVEVSDGINSITTSITVDVTSSTVISDVLASGDVINTKITQEELIDATLDEIEATRTLLQDAKVKIFNLKNDGTAKDDGSSLTSIDWTPTHDASMLHSTLGKNSAFLYTNAVESDSYTVYKKEIAILGEKANARYMVFGANPFRNEINDEMNSALKNSISWLTGREDLNSTSFNVVIAHLDESYWFRDESKTRAWLDTNYGGNVHYNSENSCDNTALLGCLDDSTDLLIISQVSKDSDNLSSIVTAVNQALSNGISVLYVHHDGNLKPLGKELFSSVFDISYQGDNYWKKLKLEAYNPTVDMNILPESLQKIKTMFTHLKNKDYAFDWSMCKDSNGNRNENSDDCSDVVGLNSEFQEGANEVRNIFNAFDKAKKNIFMEDGYKFQKLLALTGDKFRQSVVYPMDKVTTDDNEFMKSYYADHAVYNYRAINPVQPDMGNFSRSDFSHITPITKTVNLISKKSFRSTGAYALPGQTVRVTRNDSSDVVVKVRINTLRSGATHQYQKNGYKRPKYLTTPYFELKKDETVEFTSPYGGTLQLYFNKNDLPVEVTFENVGEHAYWASSADNASFAEKLKANEYDWAEISTAGFEVHSKLDKMIQSVNNEKWGSAEALAQGVYDYTSNYPHVLAGFKGEGVDVVPEIHDWATSKGLTIETIDTMKHMNADQASCGYGCSGNPYDAYWAFDPIGHGDIHEMGHSMQMMRFEGFPNHAATNTFSYYTKSRYFANTGGEPSCQGLPFKKLFDTIQASVGKEDVEGYLKTNLWDKAGLGEQYLLKIEAMMHAQKLGKLENGWHVLARVHILEREMRRAKKDWDARKASVGFSTYSLDEINNIRNNDWLIVAYSYASELDLRNYFTMMGIPHSAKAYEQIATFGFDVAPNSLFVSTPEGYCKTDEYGTIFDRPTLPIDGTTAYSY